jgi:hypothetical protein
MKNFKFRQRMNVKMRLTFLLFFFITLLFCSWQSSDFLDEIQTKYDRYVSRYPQVKLDLVFNQPCYALGDTAFFRALYLNESFLPVKGSHTIIVDLVSGDKQTKQRIKFKVQDGTGYNQLSLRNDLVPGEYKLVAYTEWMKNFNPQFFFQKKIQIVSRKEIWVKRSLQKDSVKFFPEGKHLIRDVQTTVAITGPPMANLLIKNNSDADIKKISLDSTGFGIFNFVPAVNEKYYAIEESKGSKWTLPSVEQDGIAISYDVDKIQLKIPSKSKWENRSVFAVLIEKGKIILKRELAILEGKTIQVELPTRGTQTSFQFYLLDEKGRALGERVIMSPARQNVNIKWTLPSIVAQRENVSMEVRIQDSSDESLPSEFTVSVLQDKFFNKRHVTNPMLSDFPPLQERIERWGLFSDNFINDFLITQPGKISWSEVLSEKLPEMSRPFQDQIQFKGQILSKKSGVPPPDSTSVIVYLQRNMIGYEGFTKKGNFEIPFIFDFSGEDNIFCTIQNKSKILDEEFNVLVSMDSMKQSESWVSGEGDRSSAYGEYVFNKKMISNSYAFFNSKSNSSAQQNENPNKSFEDEFLGADYSISVKDYVMFPKMEDLLREVVPFVQYRKKGSEETIRLLFRTETSVKIYKNTPLFIIDGVMSRNTNLFLKMKPEEILVIKVLNNPSKLIQLGKLGENGVIFVESKKRNVMSQLSGQNIFSVVGLSSPIVPGSLGYVKSKADRTPDLRSTLYWNPRVKTSNSGKATLNFSASDDVGKMRILIQGITEDGQPFYAEKELEVGFQSAKK